MMEHAMLRSTEGKRRISYLCLVDVLFQMPTDVTLSTTSLLCLQINVVFHQQLTYTVTSEACTFSVVKVQAFVSMVAKFHMPTTQRSM